MAKMNYNRPIFKQMDDKKKIVPAQADIMKFGKYKGKHIKDLPSDYLVWLVQITPDDEYALKYCRELARRPEYKK